MGKRLRNFIVLSGFATTDLSRRDLAMLGCGAEPEKTWPPCGLLFLHHATVRFSRAFIRMSFAARRSRTAVMRSDRVSEESRGEGTIPTSSTDA